MAYRKTQISITTNEGSVDIDAYATKSPFLAVHRSYATRSYHDSGSSWKVTHIPTGLGCCSYPFDTLRAAMSFANRFAELVDFDFTDPKHVERNRDQFKNAYQRARGFSSTGEAIMRAPTRRPVQTSRRIAAPRPPAPMPDPVDIDRSGATVGGSVRVVPAYGRDYSSVKAVKASLLANQDFIIADISDCEDGRYINLQQIKPSTVIYVRYARLTKQARVEL